MTPRQRRRPWLSVFGFVVAGVLVLAACSSSSKSSTGSSTTSATSAPAGSSPATSAPASSSPATGGTGPGTPAPKPLATPTNITFGVSAKIEVFSEPEVALMLGEFKKENLNVKITVAPANSVPQLLAQGTVQVVLNGINAGTYNATYNNVNLEYIGDPYSYQPTDPTGLWVKKTFLNPDGTIKKPLPSSFTVSLGQAGISAPSILQTEQWLEKNGYTYNNVRNVALAQPDIVTALLSGSLDAGYANTPFAQQLISNPNFEKVTGPALAVGDILTSASYIQSHRDVVDAVMRALIRTARTDFGSGYRNNAQVMGVVSSWLGVPLSTIDKSPPVIFSQDYSLAPLSQPFQQMQEVWIKLGNILQYKQPIPNSKFVDTSILMDVLGYVPSS